MVLPSTTLNPRNQRANFFICFQQVLSQFLLENFLLNLCLDIKKSKLKRLSPQPQPSLHWVLYKYIWRLHILKRQVSPCRYKIGGCFLFYFNKRETSSLKQKEKRKKKKKQPCRKASFQSNRNMHLSLKLAPWVKPIAEIKSLSTDLGESLESSKH